MKLHNRRRAVTAPLVLAAAVVGLTFGSSVAVAAPSDTATHGVVGSYTATQPGDIAVDSVTHRAYATQYGPTETSLSVVDTNTGSQLPAVKGVVAYQSAVAVDSVLSRAYVSSSYGGAISVVDTKSGDVIKTVTLSEKNPDGTRPQISDIAVDPVTHRAYFSDYKSGYIRVLDAAAGDAVTNILIDKFATPTKLGFDNKRGFLYVADTNFMEENYGRTLWQIDVRAGSTPKAFVRGSDIYPVELAVDDNTGYVYMTDTRTANVWVIDATPNNDKVLEKITFSADTTANGVAVDTAAGVAYVADVKQGQLWTVDLSNRGTALLADTKVPEFDRVKNLAIDSSTGAIAATTNAGKVTVVAAYPTLKTAELPAAQTGKAYSQKLAVNGARAATFKVASGDLPAGLTLANDGTISGTPTVAGSYTVEVTATSVLSRTTSVTVVVSEAPVGPVDPGNPGNPGTGSLDKLPGLGSLGR
ncbi:DNA-binding beta-propeller fold protein YncE [Rhodococcus sp. 27YEA15]|uniref:putative Ig domain-containing protein n=1 Tax=Rhodococcus sp. 27YEA15 TaxID=3156259 RepID=UPI003C7E96F2